MKMAQRLSFSYRNAKVSGTFMKAFVHPPAELFAVSGYLHPVEGKFLTWLARRARGNGLVLEVGSYQGRSSGFLAHGLRNGAKLVCVDTWNNDTMPYDNKSDVMGLFLENMRRFGGKYEICRGTSFEVARSWDRPIDVLFIGGDHSYEGCASDLKAWLPFVRPGGWVALHDTGVSDVTRAIEILFPPAKRIGVPLRVWSIFASKRR